MPSLFIWAFWSSTLLAQLSLASSNLTTSTLSPWQIWGPYRPNLYFGLRPQIPDTLLMGLMWASGDDRKKLLTTIRDTCEQNDGMQGYGWTYYDTRVGGSQVIHDTQLQIDLETAFLKTDDGDNWAVLVTGNPKLDSVKTSLIFHAAVEKADSNGPKTLVCNNRVDDDEKGIEASCEGEIATLGNFQFEVIGDNSNKAIHSTAVKSVHVGEDKIWQAKSVFIDQIKTVGGGTGQNVAVENKPGAGNMHFFQLTFQGPFNVTFSYKKQEATALDGNALKTGLDSLRSKFHINVDKVFPRLAPFDQDQYRQFSKEILSNLLGGLGFFHGDTKMDNTRAPEYQETDLEFWVGAAAAMARAQITTTPPLTLLSYTPSRPFFPRGFLWDEGFHLLPVIEWDLDQAVSVLRSWLSLMDEDGWIGREQILGPEARSRVPEQFQVQYPHYANPPTLSLLFPILVEKLTNPSTYSGHPSVYIESKERASDMFKELYPLLSRHYQWFRRTQAGKFSGLYSRPDGAVKGEGYRWRGRTPQHCLTSGLDDYPRANPPHPGELHVDALAWVGASARALQQVAKYLGEDTDAAIFEQHVSDIKHNLDILHWNPETKTYCDATIQNDNKYTFICRDGYLSLFPLLLGHLHAEHPNLPAVLDLLSDESKLWSPYGLRSLSAKDPDYARDEDYWRGAVWMNLNVLATLRLRDIGLEQTEYTRIRGPSETQTRALNLAVELRKRLVDTVYNSWEKSGFFWEQYKDKTGEGSHSRAFTGWTACVILLLGLKFNTSNDGERGHDDGDGGGGGVLVVVAMGFMVLMLMVTVLRRRRILVLLAGFVESVLYKGWRRGQGDYEEVIDLDELDA
ncbi:glycoside hydrolase [Podospora fimiseda]|uniref:Mannosyl-oligosaccharide glucosidase n=1 Tax=Podospora fimiseda TaxID=252190 RepID=A0AAN7BZR9_9PEZI|nr:glycoside hydrolase [Podospora fimiseda]